MKNKTFEGLFYGLDFILYILFNKGIISTKILKKDTEESRQDLNFLIETQTTNKYDWDWGVESRVKEIRRRYSSGIPHRSYHLASSKLREEYDKVYENIRFMLDEDYHDNSLARKLGFDRFI